MFVGYHRNHKKELELVYMFWEDAVSALETFVWILNLVSRSTTWFLFTLKA